MRLRALLVLAGVCAAVVVLEVACRFGYWPNTLYRVDAARRRGEGAYRVLILGDSFIQPPSNLGRNLQRYFADRGAVCLNLAYRGTGPLDYLRAFKYYAPAFSPNLVILNYTTTNDLTDVLYRRTPDVDYWLTYKSRRPRCYLWNAAVETWRIWRDTRFIQAARRRNTGALANPFLAKRPESAMLNLDVPPQADAAWEKIARVVVAVQDDCGRMNARLLINIFPATEQVNASHYAVFREAGLHIEERLLQESRIQDRFIELCRRRGIACEDELPAFRRRRREEFFGDGDDHFNAKGDDLALALITGKLKALGW